MPSPRLPFTFALADEERDQPHYVFLFAEPVPKAKRPAVERALPSAFEALYDLRWTAKNRLALEATDAFVWDVFQGPDAEASFDKTLRAFAAAVNRAAPLAAISDVDGTDADLRALVALRAAKGPLRIRAIADALEAGHEARVLGEVDALVATPEEHRIDAMKEAPSPRLLLDGVERALDRLGPVATFQALTARRVIARLPYAIACWLEPDRFEERAPALGLAWKAATPAVRDVIARPRTDDGPRMLLARAAVLAAGEAWEEVVALFDAYASNAERRGRPSAQEKQLLARAERLHGTALEALGRATTDVAIDRALPALDLATIATGAGLTIRGKVTGMGWRVGLLDDGTASLFTLWGPVANLVAEGDELICEGVEVKHQDLNTGKLRPSRTGYVIVIDDRSVVRLASGESLESRTPRASVEDFSLGILDDVTAPLWREALARLQRATDAELVAVAPMFGWLKVGKKPLAALPRSAMLAALGDPVAAKVSPSNLPAMFGAPLRMVGEIDFALAERLCLAVLAHLPQPGGLAASAVGALPRSTSDVWLALLLSRLVDARDLAAQDALKALAHPGTTAAALVEAERLLGKLTPRPRSRGADLPPTGEEALTYGAQRLIQIACARDPAVARARFLSWRSQGGVLPLAALKGLSMLCTDEELAAKGVHLGPFDRVNDPKLETFAHLLV